MALFNEPAQWDHTLGNNADTSTLPDDAAATAGIASLQKLFQTINATPLEAGGIAPDREDVNALFKYLGDQIFYTQNGGIPSYNADYDYVAGRVVLYNGNLYKCIQANGVSSIVVTPDSNTAYWQRLDNFVRSVNGVSADAQGNVTIQTDNFAPDYNASVSKLANITYTATCNGWVACTESNSLDFRFTMNGVAQFDGILSVTGNNSLTLMFPIGKGDTYACTANFIFYPCKGAN